ncbi:MAG TPA: PAC2 family protein [Acidimicrobiales bacterium]|nr:PAC2 family protein [Acidimicrobiales bacterium]
MYRREREISLDSPILVMGMEGWIDAGFGAMNAMAAVRQSIETEPVITFDGDLLLDYRSRRPTMRIENGINTGLTWPTIELRAGRDAAGNDVLLLVGPEPDQQWRAFTTAVCELASSFGVRLAVGLGAFPGPAPHTRPVRLSATATTPELASHIGFMPGVIEVPSGIHGALERGLDLVGIPAVGVWARVPMYVAGSAYPAASVALVEALSRLTGLSVDLSELRAAEELARQRIDQLIAQSGEHLTMVAGLEQQADAEATETESSPLTADNLPSGDEIAAELERFLRGEGGQPGQGGDFPQR